jgi:hypothetical protein
LLGFSGWRRRESNPPPEETVLYAAVRDNLATLLAEAGELGRRLPRYVERDFAKYLECGVLAHGFARCAVRVAVRSRFIPSMRLEHGKMDLGHSDSQTRCGPSVISFDTCSDRFSTRMGR